MSLTNCRYCLQSPALQPSWASAAQQRIDSQRRASCRCAGSAAVSTSSQPSFESWSHHETIGLSWWHPLSAVGRWLRNRLDFVRPGTVAGQIAIVSVVVGKTDTRIRDGPDGTPVRETIPGIGRRITLSGHPFVSAYGQSGPLMAPGCGAAYRLAGARCSATLTTSASLRGISTGSRTPPPKRRGGVGTRTASMPT